MGPLGRCNIEHDRLFDNDRPRQARKTCAALILVTTVIRFYPCAREPRPRADVSIKKTKELSHLLRLFCSFCSCNSGPAPGPDIPHALVARRSGHRIVCTREQSRTDPPAPPWPLMHDDLSCAPGRCCTARDAPPSCGDAPLVRSCGSSPIPARTLGRPSVRFRTAVPTPGPPPALATPRLAPPMSSRP